MIEQMCSDAHIITLTNQYTSTCTYVKKNASYEGICVEFERKKQYKIGFPTFQFPASTYFMTDMLCIISDEFSS